MPACVERKPITGREMKKAAKVATPHAMRDTISTRRSASRCSITDMRGSSIGALDRRPRCRTLLSKATGKPVSARRGAGLGRRALGGALGGGWGGWWRWLRLGLGSRRDLVGQLRRRLAELAHRLPDGAAELRQPARPEDDQHDDQQDDYVNPMATEHLDAIIDRRWSGEDQRGVKETLIVIEVIESVVWIS